MSVLDVFNGDAFSVTSLTQQVDRFSYTPSFLGSVSGLFFPKPVRTNSVWIETRDFAPALIQTSPRGAPPKQVSGDERGAKSFKTTRLADASRITAEELQGVRAFGEEQAVKDLQLEVARRQMKIKQNFELTKEHMRLGAIQGLVQDADGSTIYSWFDEFGVNPNAVITFPFAGLAAGTTAEGAILTLCNQINRATLRALKGLGGNNVVVHAICGDGFWDAFVTSSEVRDTYRFAMQALQLQNDVGSAFESFRYGRIMWHNYRGTDDNSTVAVPTNGVRFFPVGAEIFPVAQSPAEKFEFVNTPGQDVYSWIVPDRDRDMWADVEVYSYPLHVCIMPQALNSGQAG
jgi:hypothetical protein